MKDVYEALKQLCEAAYQSGRTAAIFVEGGASSKEEQQKRRDAFDKMSHELSEAVGYFYRVTRKHSIGAGLTDALRANVDAKLADLQAALAVQEVRIYDVDFSEIHNREVHRRALKYIIAVQLYESALEEEYKKP